MVTSCVSLILYNGDCFDNFVVHFNTRIIKIITDNINKGKTGINHFTPPPKWKTPETRVEEK